jgi:hypothetical protein
MLQEVLHLAKEVRRECQDIRPRLAEPEATDILDQLKAHFIARQRIKAFEDTGTAWVLSIDGQKRLRGQDAHLLDRTSLSPSTQLTPLDCLIEVQQGFQDLFRPWNPTEIATEQEDRMIIDAFAEEANAPRVPGFDRLDTPADAISSAPATFLEHERREFQRSLADRIS